MPSYTVIMPAKNAEHTIGAAIKSTLNAFPMDTQIAVWDDGSSDRTAEVAQNIDATRVTVTRTTKSVGSGLARQRLLEATDSEYVVIQDADDISLPWRFKLQSQYLENTDLVFAAAQRFTSWRQLHRPSIPFNLSSTDVAISLLFHNPFAHSTMVARRSALMGIGGYSDSRVAQDYEMLLRAAHAGARIRRIGLPTVLYRVSSTQISGQNDYAARVLSSEVILTSYGRLLQSMLPHINLNFPDMISLPDLRNSVNQNHAMWLISRMRPHLRPYYRHLHSRQRFGHIAAEALE